MSEMERFESEICVMKIERDKWNTWKMKYEA